VAATLSVRLRIDGILIQTLIIDVYNDGFDGVGLEVSIFSGNNRSTFTAARLASKTIQSFTLGGVKQLPSTMNIVVGIALRDVDGHEHRYGAGPFDYARVAGWLNMTKSLTINPGEWVVAAVES
jgi:hypothetical protein